LLPKDHPLSLHSRIRIRALNQVNCHFQEFV
jgi:hypothetical protein